MDADRQTQLLGVVRRSLMAKAARYESDTDLTAATIDELALDSLDKMQLVLDLETALSVMANETEVVACRNIGELIDLMVRSPSVRQTDA